MKATLYFDNGKERFTIDNGYQMIELEISDAQRIAKEIIAKMVKDKITAERKEYKGGSEL